MLVVKNQPANAGDMIAPLGGEDSLEEGTGNRLQYSCLENEFHGQKSLVDYNPWDLRVGYP